MTTKVTDSWSREASIEPGPTKLLDVPCPRCHGEGWIKGRGRQCPQCGQWFQLKPGSGPVHRRTKIWCSDGCRMKAYRIRSGRQKA